MLSSGPKGTWFAGFSGLPERFLVYLVCLVYLVSVVYLVCLVCLVYVMCETRGTGGRGAQFLILSPLTFASPPLWGEGGEGASQRPRYRKSNQACRL
ncbi:hypothetical protein NITMOv2_3354 [Nitrospira moscoviensis]|uniref:Uncharacterized protein n=1 Tax=Nitrospira moscoviensis TaxID=42253 RepID=A0A0K2GFL9_NITMO|nr:hypothetical protein NITMOv2_3354 [Nitrospira moscoviensis]